MVIKSKDILQNKLFSGMFDKNIDVTNEKYFCIFVRFVHNSEIQTYLLHYLTVEDERANNL